MARVSGPDMSENVAECRAAVNVFHLSQHLELPLVFQSDQSFVLDLNGCEHNLLRLLDKMLKIMTKLL